MSKIDASLMCPACQQPLRPRLLGCDGCGIQVEGPFHLNEFATLTADDLHFLRIFVRAEGRIREMEAALGLSYPTIRARISALKNKLFGQAPAADARTETGSPAINQSAQQTLERLQAGEISFEEAMQELKRRPSREESK